MNLTYIFYSTLDKSDPGLQYQNLPHFNRFSTAGFFTVTNAPVGNTDVLPPSRVTDLGVTSVEPEKKFINLTWTAPGDDLDSGTGS